MMKVVKQNFTNELKKPNERGKVTLCPETEWEAELVKEYYGETPENFDGTGGHWVDGVVGGNWHHGPKYYKIEEEMIYRGGGVPLHLGTHPVYKRTTMAVEAVYGGTFEEWAVSGKSLHIPDDVIMQVFAETQPDINNQVFRKHVQRRIEAVLEEVLTTGSVMIDYPTFSKGIDYLAWKVGLSKANWEKLVGEVEATVLGDSRIVLEKGWGVEYLRSRQGD